MAKYTAQILSTTDSSIQQWSPVQPPQKAMQKSERFTSGATYFTGYIYEMLSVKCLPYNFVIDTCKLLYKFKD